MKPLFAVTADDVIEQLMIQCWVFEARGGERDAARAAAEKTLERLLSKGLPYLETPQGMRFDPYAANNMLKSRATEQIDEAWADWQRTTRRNATSLPSAPHMYRFTMRREWHSYSVTAGRPVVLRMPLPLRQSQIGPARVQVLEPADAIMDIRESTGRIELRLDAAQTRGPLVVELEVDFISGEQHDSAAVAAPLGFEVPATDQIWTRLPEGALIPSTRVSALADELASRSSNVRDFVHHAWRWLMLNLRFGDVHRESLSSTDPLGGLMESRLSDCMLGSSLLVALCRSKGIPARMLSGYLLHPANLGPHSWAEVQLAPGIWAPFDYGSWCYCAGDADDADWGNFFRGRVDARFIAEVAPRDFTGWGSAPPPERWFRLERLNGQQIEHTLHTAPDGALFRRDRLDLKIITPMDGAQRSSL